MPTPSNPETDSGAPRIRMLRSGANLAVAEVTTGNPPVTLRVQFLGLAFGGKRALSFYTTCSTHPRLELTTPFRPSRPENIDCGVWLPLLLRLLVFRKRAIAPILEHIYPAGDKPGPMRVRAPGQALNVMTRGGYMRALALVRALAPAKATLLRASALLLMADDLLTAFHRSPGLRAITFRVDHAPERPEDLYEVSARTACFELDGDDAPPSAHGLVVANAPLELMSSSTFTLDRDNPLVQRSLTDAGGRDRLLRHRIVHELASELDTHLRFP